MKNQCLCIAIINGNRQCSRKGKQNSEIYVVYITISN